MKRLRHWLFNLAIAVSLLVFVATAVVWPRSYWKIDSLTNYRFPNRDIVGTQPGRLIYCRVRNDSGDLAGWDYKQSDYGNNDLLDGPSDRRLDLVGFGYRGWQASLNPGSGQAAPLVEVFYLPLWSVFFISAILPVAKGLRVFQQRRTQLRRNSNCCAACGYDLRVTPDRCPECGMIPEGMKA